MEGTSTTGGGALAERFRRARRDPELAVLEGFHALKHALRFGARVDEAVGTDVAALERLAADLAPDLAEAFASLITTVSGDVLACCAPHVPRTGVLAIARRPSVDPAVALADPRVAPIVLLEDPRTMANMGACVRVAAAADAAAVLTTGASDPWHPDALRGAAGLHYALPVARIDDLPALGDRPLLAIDPDGDELRPGDLPARAILAFGTEREGLSGVLLQRADGRLRIPMRAGVSSLNLATSVAAVLYAWRLHTA
ncbi:MAG: TrmH family RNA methyltransferase [Solirubrobacteraceae bacterium]|nr:TrmH family RNA methyltransferase [Solirubrobacteraceae bacterium]